MLPLLSKIEVYCEEFQHFLSLIVASEITQFGALPYIYNYPG